MVLYRTPLPPVLPTANVPSSQGKRKKSSRKPTGPKKSEPLATTFACLFCNHERAVTCKLDKKAGIGSLLCKICGQRFQANINYLSAAIDVYSEWVDACDEVANPKEKPAVVARPTGAGADPKSQSQLSHRGPSGGMEDEDDEDGLYGGGSGHRSHAVIGDDDDDDF